MFSFLVFSHQNERNERERKNNLSNFFWCLWLSFYFGQTATNALQNVLRAFVFDRDLCFFFHWLFVLYEQTASSNRETVHNYVHTRRIIETQIHRRIELPVASDNPMWKHQHIHGPSFILHHVFIFYISYRLRSVSFFFFLLLLSMYDILWALTKQSAVCAS